MATTTTDATDATPTEPSKQRVRRYPLIDPGSFKMWVAFESDTVLIVNKPADVLCHPTKNGPWSSLVSAARLSTNIASLHLVSRLDRETSGLVSFAKTRPQATVLAKAFEQGNVFKRYFAILRGEMEAVDCTVTAPLGKDTESTAWNRNVVLQDPADTDAQPASHETHYIKPKWRDIWIRAVFWSQHLASTLGAGAKTRLESSIMKFKPHLIYDSFFFQATTIFHRMFCGHGFTLASVTIETGRKHQIRYHFLFFLSSFSPLLSYHASTHAPLLSYHASTHAPLLSYHASTRI